MSGSPIPSDLIHVICQSLAAFAHSGLELSPEKAGV
ncbi:hypothetical protein H4S14_003380 [Agrobacterium vitis]|nr:hypothetical protein [Agrobacterium vitis]MBE1439615.1 hypothetical protein [Agrobacterium vitis]